MGRGALKGVVLRQTILPREYDIDVRKATTEDGFRKAYGLH